VEIELNNNHFYYNQNVHSYNHMKSSKDPNQFHEEIKPDTAFEDGGIISSNEKKNDKKDKNNWDINTNIENDENNINNENFDNELNNNNNNKKYSNEEDEEKIDDDIPYQSKVSDINNDNNINNEDNIQNDDNKVNNLIDEENSSSRNEKIDKNQEGMSEKNY
jgi:hypothetical protein